jgi:hypothetical protein
LTAVRVRPATLLVVTLALGDCANLPEIPADTCGNGVIEQGEDCDLFAPIAGSVCRAKGTVGACHLDCRRDGSGKAGVCPARWGCDAEGICRAPSGGYEAPLEIKIGGISSLLAGDFDGDLRQDVVSLGPLDHLGMTKIRTNYFDQTGALVSSRLFPKRVGSLVVADLSGDRLSDLVFSNLRVGLLLGQPDRNLVPETFSSYHIPDAPVRMYPIYSESIQTDSPATALSKINGKAGFYYPDPKTGLLIMQGELPSGPETFAGDPVSGNVIEDPQTSPCWELVFAVGGATAFSVVDSCRRDPQTGEVQWREQVEQWAVALEPPATIDVAPLLADINGDGHLDVMVGAEGKVYVAYGDGGHLAPATPYELPVVEDLMATERRMPLAAGDLNGDNVVDFVFDNHVVISHHMAGTTSTTYHRFQENTGARWTVARIADFNGNGKLDVVAASSGGLDLAFFNGTGDTLTAFDIPTSGTVKYLAVGDFDGDLINDLAFIEAAASPRERDAVMIAFGTPAGPPVAPVVIARVSRPENLSAYHERGVGNVVVSSSETVDNHTNGLLTILEGSGDRLPLAPHGLTDLSSGAVFASPVLGLTLGGFIAGGHGDALAVALDPFMGTINLWMLPALATSDRVPIHLDWTPEPRLEPYHLSNQEDYVNAVGTSADVDNDGRDESLWAIPADDLQHCGLLLVGIAGDGSASLRRAETLVVDDPCLGPQLQAVDVDHDGWMDVVLLTGAPEADGRKLLVLWNDGHGRFAREALAVVSPPGVSVQAFAVLPAPAGRPALAYVTSAAAGLLTPGASARDFVSLPPLAPLERGSGIVAADVNGDGVVDLVVADSGNLKVMKAHLLP